MTDSIVDKELRALAEERDITVDYSDEDLVFIDNAHVMAAPEYACLPMNAVVVCTAGRVRFDLGSTPLELHENEVFISPPGTFLSNYLFSPDFKFKLVLVSNRLVQQFLDEKINLWNRTLYVNKLRVVSIPAEQTGFLEHFYAMLRYALNTKADDIPYRTDIIQSVLRTGFLALCAMLSQNVEGVSTGHTAQHLFRQFIDVLSATKAKHQPVAYYAGQLFVSAKYLSAVCKQTSGRTAREWITEYLQEDIRHYLRATNLSMKQIADVTGFPNASFFGRYVLEHFGASPRAFREGHETKPVG